MKISIFTTISWPLERGDDVTDALRCYEELADELVIVNGGSKYNYIIGAHPICDIKLIDSKWPYEFDWPFIGEQFQRGYEACTGDWILHCDIDWIFHQKDFGKIRQAFKDFPNQPALSFYKWQFLVPDKYNLKSRLVIAVNKGVYGDRIKFNGGGDLCQPTLDGRQLTVEETTQAEVPFYNYEKLTKTKEQIVDDVGRMDRAYFKHFGEYQYGNDGTNETAYGGWLRMMQGRLTKPHKAIPLSDHPQYIQETLKNLKPDQWGYSGFGSIERNDYA